MALKIIDHEKSKRVKVLKINSEDIDRLAFPFKKHAIQSLEYKPFSRFTLAKSLDDLYGGELSKQLNKILNDRASGTIIIETDTVNKKVDKDFLVKLSTATAHLVGTPNHDAMDGRYYARFTVKHVDASDSYLRKAYTNLDLHTDGTYVNEKTDWLLMTKLEEQNVIGGESVLLHLDDWEHLDNLISNPVSSEDITWGSPKSKNVDYKVSHPVFFKDKNGKYNISYIDQFPEPKNMEQGLFLQTLSDSLEESKNKITFPLPVGSMILSNNHFWLHGRKPFKEHTGLSRELLRIRGANFN